MNFHYIFIYWKPSYAHYQNQLKRRTPIIGFKTLQDQGKYFFWDSWIFFVSFPASTLLISYYTFSWKIKQKEKEGNHDCILLPEKSLGRITFFCFLRVNSIRGNPVGGKQWWRRKIRGLYKKGVLYKIQAGMEMKFRRSEAAGAWWGPWVNTLTFVALIGGIKAGLVSLPPLPPHLHLNTYALFLNSPSGFKTPRILASS